MKKFNYLPFLLTFFLLAVSCEKENILKNGCYKDMEVVKLANDVKGVITILDSKHPNIWSISSSEGIIGEEGPTYDTRDVIIACNLPESFKQEGLQVIFSGALISTEDEFEYSPNPVYYSELDEIKKLKMENK